jgi:di/tricarboxylate transporter
LSFVREIIDALLKEIKSGLREYFHETEAAVKKRLQKLLITGIIVSILVSLVISLVGSAALFLLIGQLKYLSTMMPVWAAWDVMGLTSGVIAAVLLVVLFYFIKKQLRTNQN